MSKVLITILNGLIINLLTEKYLKKLTILFLRSIVDRTSNNIDNQFVDVLEQALNTPSDQTEQH